MNGLFLCRQHAREHDERATPGPLRKIGAWLEEAGFTNLHACWSLPGPLAADSRHQTLSKLDGPGLDSEVRDRFPSPMRTPTIPGARSRVLRGESICMVIRMAGT